MTIIHVPIVRWMEDYQPPIVECLLVDAHEKEWKFVHKLVYFSSVVGLYATSEYPQPGFLACEIIGEKLSGDGRKILTVDTEKPWDIEATDGTTQFDVWPEQVEEEIARE